MSGNELYKLVLKPCPFCGANVSYNLTSYSLGQESLPEHEVRCFTCGGNISVVEFCKTREQAIREVYEKWNSRA